MSGREQMALSGRRLARTAATKSGRAATLGKLKARKRLAGGDVFVDYGWIKLLFSDDGDRQELHYHVHQHEWHAKDMAFYSRHIKPGSTVVDVGANMGFVTSMLASLVGPTGSVISFEPSRSTYAKLQKTIAVNELTQVVPYNKGIGATRETLELVSVSTSSGNNTLVPAAGDHASNHETVEIIPLSDVPSEAAGDPSCDIVVRASCGNANHSAAVVRHHRIVGIQKRNRNPREESMRRHLPLRKKLLASLIRTAVVATALGPTISWAQTADATLRGKAPANATVTAKNISTGAVRRTTASADGSYALVGLPPGAYTIDAGAGTEQNVTLSVASTLTLDLTAAPTAPIHDHDHPRRRIRNGARRCRK